MYRFIELAIGFSYSICFKLPFDDMSRIAKKYIDLLIGKE